MYSASFFPLTIFRACLIYSICSVQLAQQGSHIFQTTKFKAFSRSSQTFSRSKSRYFYMNYHKCLHANSQMQLHSEIIRTDIPKFSRSIKQNSRFLYHICIIQIFFQFSMSKLRIQGFSTCVGTQPCYVFSCIIHYT